MDPTTPVNVIFQPVSLNLAKARRFGLLFLLIPIIATVVLGYFWPWVWIGTALLVVLLIWRFWLIKRQVQNLFFAQTEKEFMIRSGVMFRSLTVIPYDRIQYVDLSVGPVDRHFGIASLTINTAAESTSGSISGLPSDKAAELRDFLSSVHQEQLGGGL